MRIAYVNTYFQSKHTGGGHVHMGQFVANSVALGNEIWSYPNQGYADIHTIPVSRISHIKTMRRMDALYVRVESRFPEICSWSLPPRRVLYGFPVVVWEFNTTPESELLRGRSKKDVREIIQSFKHYGQGCDLAVCMTKGLADYVQENFGIRRVLIVPNGSDPELFHPQVALVKRMQPFQDKLNVVWMGSAKESWHDFQLMSEAAQLLWETEYGNSINFHIIGPDLAGVMAGMAPNVFYWGAEYYGKLPGWLAGMDVGLSLYRPGPADYATPLKVFDYMASGLTVISTPQPFMIDLLTQLGQPDLLVPSGDAKRLANVLIGLASNKERVKRQGLAGRQLVIDHYNWKRAVQDTMNEIESILAEKQR